MRSSLWRCGMPRLPKASKQHSCFPCLRLSATLSIALLCYGAQKGAPDVAHCPALVAGPTADVAAHPVPWNRPPPAAQPQRGGVAKPNGGVRRRNSGEDAGCALHRLRQLAACAQLAVPHLLLMQLLCASARPPPTHAPTITTTTTTRVNSPPAQLSSCPSPACWPPLT